LWFLLLYIILIYTKNNRVNLYPVGVSKCNIKTTRVVTDWKHNNNIIVNINNNNIMRYYVKIINPQSRCSSIAYPKRRVSEWTALFSIHICSREQGIFPKYSPTSQEVYLKKKKSQCVNKTTVYPLYYWTYYVLTVLVSEFFHINWLNW